MMRFSVVFLVGSFLVVLMVVTVLSQVESVEKMQSILNTAMNTNTRK